MEVHKYYLVDPGVWFKLKIGFLLFQLGEEKKNRLPYAAGIEIRVKESWDLSNKELEGLNEEQMENR